MSETAGCKPETSFQIALSSLRQADSPRFGIDLEHVQRLAESDAEFQPIVVHRETMRVVDGMHRVHAMRLRGHHTLAAQWFEGDEQAAFLLAVESNVQHGLPLSREERKQAALRILRCHPDWSDRSIAKMSGLSAKSVATIRQKSGKEDAAPEIRIGCDGRARPSSTAAGRAAAAEVIKQNPTASLREIARQTGISVGTVRDVRRRLASGQEPVPEKQRKGCTESRASLPAVVDRRSVASVSDHEQRMNLFDRLRKDPSLRLSENGRFVLHQLRTQLCSTEDWKRLAPAIPMHGRSAVAEILSACADDLLEVAQELRRIENSLAG
ncbi:winged helix-turn-helix transcriptional regulator [Streptomyces sp. DH24]|uniref:winged helix-turn-helix transcriptional regulator n=1 Tax=Streptomyces sp. DH24 TaxID=3040123 RepID=UPI0024430CE7|nr:winged helix-turn-helix transcriptional regulator [Streptomyces sp. DH24]MDG9716052.1 winged helix-turn-helix transcriptional regulator [Streptomyces sp. DH24]